MIADLHIFLFIPQDAEIIRTRDPAKLADCDIVVDVGGEFDPKRHRYDHHQRYGAGRKYAAELDLIYKCLKHDSLGLKR